MRINRKRKDREIAEELAAHVALRAEANRAAGMGAGEAEREAERRLGSELALRERTREAALPRWRMWLEDAARDIALAGRALRRSPGFTVVAVATLALGIGAATAMFSVVHIVLLDPLPFPHAQRLVQILVQVRERDGGDRIRAFDNVTGKAVAPLRRSGIFAGVGIFTYAREQTIFVHGLATDTGYMLASPRAFATLGVRPELGRGFSAGAGQHEMMVTDKFWRTELQGDRTAIGKPLRVGDEWYTLVGVLPPTMSYPPGRQVWLAGMPAPGDDGIIVARMKSGQPLATVRRQTAAALAVIGKRLAPPGNKRGMTGLTMIPLRTLPVKPKARTSLWVLFAAVGCLLLIACANTAGLLLARGLGRARELAVRRTLGASRARVIRLLLAEGLWLALAGGLGGAALAWLLTRLAPLGPSSVPRLEGVRLNPTVLGFATAIAFASGLACAVAPALRLSEPNLRGGLRAGVLVTRTARLRWLLVVGEVAMTLVLLVGGMLLLGSFNHLLRESPGFHVRNMIALEVVAPASTASLAQRKARWRHHQRQDQALLQRLRALPGVSAATYSYHLPFDGVSSRDITLPGQTVTLDNFQNYAVNAIAIGPGYASAMGIRLLAGREMEPADMIAAWSPLTPILINAALARRLWPHRPAAAAVGRHVRGPGRGKAAAAVVVGVLANTRGTPAIGNRARPQFYTPALGNSNYTEFLLRSTTTPAALVAEVRQVLAQVNPQLNLAAPVTLEAAMQTALAQPRFRALLLDVFAGLALLLALVGIYGSLAYQVRQRRREIGVRMALGADNAAVLRLVLGQSLAVLAAGIGLGWLLAWAASRSIGSLLFGVGALDPAIWLGASAALLVAGLLAGIPPARRALRVDAAAVLRCE